MTSSAPFGFIQKQILVGSSSAGKSSLLIRLTDQRFLANSEPTLGVEFGCRLVSLPGGEVVKLQCWDTAGQEAFRSITRSYYRGAAGALLVFDLTHRPSFAACPGWLADLRAYGEEDLLVLLVGTKGDLCDASDGDKRATTRAEAEAFARDEGLVGYVETSALSGQGVEEAFNELTRQVHATTQAALLLKRASKPKSGLPIVLGGSGVSTSGCC